MTLTKRQVCFLILVCLLSTKLQRLPNFIATNVHRNGYLVYLILGTIDILLMLLVLLTNKKSKGRNLYEICSTAGGGWFAKFIMTLLAVFFFVSALIPYESIHDMFAYVLFDHLSWELYSLLLISAIFFLASRGLKNLGRITEIFFYLIFISLIILLALGTSTTHFERILPIYDIDFGKVLSTCFDYSIWFGDFFIVYMFIGNIKEDDGKIGWQFILVQVVGVIIVSYAYIVFYGIYENLAPNQGSLIGAISQFSLLNLDIGRVDWLLVMMFEISTFISSATFLYMAGKCLSDIFNLKKKVYVILSLVVIMYILDILLFKSVQVGAGVLSYVTRYYYPFIIIFIPISVLIATFIADKKDSKIKQKFNLQKYSTLKRKKKVEPLSLEVFKKNKELTKLKQKTKKEEFV